jgi:hypothetical protein
MYCFIEFPFLLQYLMNAKDLISGWSVTSKPTLMIPSNLINRLNLLITGLHRPTSNYSSTANFPWVFPTNKWTAVCRFILILFTELATSKLALYSLGTDNAQNSSTGEWCITQNILCDPYPDVHDSDGHRNSRTKWGHSGQGWLGTEWSGNK